VDKFFGTDGIRGTVGKPPITADFLLKVGWAVGSVLTENGPASVIIGKDTRVSGYLFESALEAGFLSAGVNVGMLGPMPSPAIAYLTKAYGASAGVVISASHNHFQDNGVMFFSSQVIKLSDKTQQAIEKKISTPMVSVDSARIGKAFRHDQALGRYIEETMLEFLKEFCQENNVDKINGKYKKTEKNSLCYHFFNKLKLIDNKQDFFEFSSNQKKLSLLNINVKKPPYKEKIDASKNFLAK